MTEWFDALSDIAAGAAAPAETGGGFWSGLGDIAKTIYGPVKQGISGFADVAKATMPLLQLGTAITGAVGSTRAAGELAEQSKIARRTAGTQERMAEAAGEAAQPLTAFGTKQLDLAAAGQVPEAVEQQILLWTQAAKQKARDYAARAGQGDSKMLEDWEAWIDQQAVAMRTQAIEGEQALGLQGLTAAGGVYGGAAGAAGAAGGTAAGQQGGLQALIMAANQELAKLSAGAA